MIQPWNRKCWEGGGTRRPLGWLTPTCSPFAARLVLCCHNTKNCPGEPLSLFHNLSFRQICFMHIISMSLLVDEKKFSISVMSQFESGGRQTKPGWSPLSLPPCRPYTSDSPRLRLSFLQIREILTFKTAFILQFIIYMLNLWQSCFKDLSTFGPIFYRESVWKYFSWSFSNEVFSFAIMHQISLQCQVEWILIPSKPNRAAGEGGYTSVRLDQLHLKWSCLFIGLDGSCGAKQWLKWP